MHHVMAALRDDVADPAEHVVAGVQDEVAGLQLDAQPDPGLLQIAVSAIVQTTNLLISMLSGRSQDKKGHE